MIRFTRSTSVRSTSVYSPRRGSAPSSRLSSCTAPRMAPSGFRTSWASPTAIRPAAALHEALGLRAALPCGKRLAEPAHDGGLRRKDLLDVAAFRAPRRALGEHLGRGVPENDPELGIDRDHRIGEARQNRLVVHGSGVREVGLNRGWPEK